VDVSTLLIAGFESFLCIENSLIIRANFIPVESLTMRATWILCFGLLLLPESSIRADYVITDIVNFTSTNNSIISVNGIWFEGEFFNISLQFRIPAKRVYVRKIVRLIFPFDQSEKISVRL
jgi:hypothetical protein